MKRFLPVLLCFVLPAAVFAQAGNAERELLKSFGLGDGDIAQVVSIEKATRQAVRADLVRIRLVRAQIAEALLPSTSGPDAQALNALIEKKGRLRTDIDTTLMSARLRLAKLIGQDSYSKYAQFVKLRARHQLREGGIRGMGMRRMAQPLRAAPPRPADPSRP
jgi:hypothetical protein